ncbi:sigma-70 family RNA polymerase sigma factor [Stutzerimonas kirkiae]|uniref:RNA polymerase subunit sigma n=1 Tax=Stutzerimonas kirkiae TaxID=2211392 RepID=A0A4Q9RBZ2_9GAMM|nr:sigma-70 family RNA polymerase sigma factor [Stutzerimonas kirkiae]TBU97775.1 RNA polymerase subunit sigma [Stutzerimonas kirkiae]TBV04874.1 RNA polymerase subunit sigma [Stutzerimonas kirkiae]TBV12010.1 RNA polymerase subunit sigma [Stutzerimonas kirkiae]TBV14981.1 RNA polymerase subunit sigma [Stutzerimonas kirkiae]
MSPPRQQHLHIERLYREQHPSLVRWFQRRLGSPQQAADLSQDAFLRLLEKTDFANHPTPLSFLRLVARGLLIDFYRRSALERSYLHYLAQQPQDLQPDPQQRVADLQQLRLIDSQLDGLPTRVKRAFLLHRLAGMSQARIAEELGLSPARIQQYLAKATLHCYRLRFDVEND